MITKKDFICKGSGGFVYYNDILYVDCDGGHLPAFGIDKYLLMFLNKIDRELGIDLTSGHRCLQHNHYSWALLAFETGDTKSIKKDTSRHIYGKASDFTVRGYTEYKKLKNLINEYRKDFHKKLLFKVYDIDDGRDSDNKLHNLPYVHVQRRNLDGLNSGNLINIV